MDNFAEYVEKSTGITTIKEDEELIKYSDGPHSVVRTTCIYTSLLYVQTHKVNSFGEKQWIWSVVNSNSFIINLLSK